ncbi:MAG: prolyl oligopeptidase family serine peptidase [Alphaproteobacteria bacterium]|nr:prolyl oligopeptidase family serine peptidase [Alphaproteobacteria bacterium]
MVGAEWTSPFDAAWVARAGGSFAMPRVVDGRVFWLHSRPTEGGRTAVIADGVDLAPSFDARSRVHEYGGGAYCPTQAGVFAVSRTDQRIWRLDGPGPSPVTAEGACRYADVRLIPGTNALVAVREDHSAGGEPVNALVRIEIATGAESVLWQGADFVAAPRPSPDGQHLAFLAWDHPSMPWDAARLMMAALTPAGLEDVVVLSGGDGTSVVEPVWAPDGRLIFLRDPDGFWNPMAWQGREVRPLWSGALEFGQPHWTFDPATLAPLADGRLAAIVASGGSRRLALVAEGGLTLIDLPGVDRVDAVVADGLDVICQVGSVDRPDRLIRRTATGAVREIASLGEGVPGGWVPSVEVQHVSRPDGSSIEALLYWPANPNAPTVTGPRPLIVQVHGGPTGAALPRFKPDYLFWTSRGYAVADVNYGGSTGRGRVERERLYGRWGEVDVEDCCAVAEALVAEGRIDPARTIIRGGSAGGLTVLLALALGQGFAAGSCWYGVTDLALLAADTHKFESRYLDQLVGPLPEAEAVYRARSPITHAERLRRPVIFLQGAEDRVVPPDQTEMMAGALADRGVPVETHLFPGEGHGFRRAETIIAALEAEHAFFARHLG